MRGQPEVDATGVEDVTALGNETQSFVVLKLVQADGTFQGAPPNFQTLDGGVDESREGADDFGVEAAGVALAAPARRSKGVGSSMESSLRTLTRADGEEAQCEEDDEENDQNNGHGFIESNLGW